MGLAARYESCNRVGSREANLAVYSQAQSGEDSNSSQAWELIVQNSELVHRELCAQITHRKQSWNVEVV